MNPLVPSRWPVSTGLRCKIRSTSCTTVSVAVRSPVSAITDRAPLSAVVSSVDDQQDSPNTHHGRSAVAAHADSFRTLRVGELGAGGCALSNAILRLPFRTLISS